MREASAECTAVAHLDVADRRGAFGQQADFVAHNFRGGDLIVRRGRAYNDLAAVIGYPGEIANLRDIDQMGRLREAELHHRQQAVSAGKKLGVVAVLFEQAESLFY